MGAIDELLCRRCGHPYESHHDTCHHVILGDWNEETKIFGSRTPCTCQAYIGIHPRHLSSCPHEFLPGSSTCVQCLKHVPARKERRSGR